MSKVNGTGGVRMELVKKFRKEINSKTYRVKSDEIASKMAKEYFNLKGPHTQNNSR